MAARHDHSQITETIRCDHSEHCREIRQRGAAIVSSAHNQTGSIIRRQVTTSIKVSATHIQAYPAIRNSKNDNSIRRREKRDIPFIITSCIREVERRGMLEVGIYRVSGSASDLARLKKAFETSELRPITESYHPNSP